MTDSAPVLTPKELEVLELSAQGIATKEIAQKLKITVKAVEQRFARALSKLNANSRTHAVVEAIRLGILEV